ncbi:muscle M-line assembly protein unc-89-like isoform X3 [Hylaeus volcanicus]|uniref:muscle M-line assembly protein unc-89-like isoform X3 n=1 Tax=Hylaeus volcanicus TaxID=313075 RepID=UPI0023B79210|nr:muscle M-line assembly protein unc-89-like isoform X3 [Hylaeus volcanicus]
MSRSRRPSVSIYDYPEHLNPFNDEITNNQPRVVYRDGKTKDTKNKFWTFGRTRKKRSNSFSIKSTWSGLFGKRKDEKSEAQEKRSTITTVSSTYKREANTKPMAPLRPTKDQQEFDEALGTLARRRKYTLDNSSSRFGQVSPKPTDKIPSLEFDDKMSEDGVTLRVKTQDRTPVPPLRRLGNRSSQRPNTGTVDPEEETNRSGDAAFCDENENVPDDYVFKRFTQDAVRKSNLSINSCISVGSTMSAYGRKKRRAPQPPRRLEKVESSEVNKTTEAPNIELQIVEPMDIARVTENIDEMTKKSKDLDKETNEAKEQSTEPVSDDVQTLETAKVEDSLVKTTEHNAEDAKSCVKEKCTEENSVRIEQTEPKNSTMEDQEKSEKANSEEPVKKANSDESAKKDENNVQIEYHRTSQENVEIIKDVNQINSPSELEEVRLRRKSSLDSLSRSDSFSVKDEIEKIEKQIKALETKNATKDSSEETNGDIQHGNTRQSLQANRRHFFQNMVDDENAKGAIKIEFKEFPREQNIHVVRLNEPPVPVAVFREPVKVIELHISEPIKQKPEIVDDINPIPKPRRHSALNLNDTRSNVVPNEERKSLESTRGKSF